MKVVLEIMNFLEKENWLIIKMLYMKENLKIIWRMEKDKSFGQMEQLLKVTFMITKKMVMVSSNGQTVLHTKEN